MTAIVPRFDWPVKSVRPCVIKESQPFQTVTSRLMQEHETCMHRTGAASHRGGSTQRFSVSVHVDAGL